MELLVLLMKIAVILLLALAGLAVLMIALFLWMVSTRTRQDSKIFQERFDGWRSSRSCGKTPPNDLL